MQPHWFSSIDASHPKKQIVAPHGWALFGVLLVSLIWRLPSLFDPPMVQDEGTYFAVAQAMANHYRLYADVWENKPPALYLMYGTVYHFFGPSLFVIRVITSISALLLVYLVWLIARNYAHQYLALAAGMLAGLLLGVPFLEGTTGNAEIFLALFAAAGVYMALVRRRAGWAGLCLGIAILFKAPACFDAAALGWWLLCFRRKEFWKYALALGSVLGVVTVIALFYGVLPAMFNDALVYDLGYVGYANGGSLPWVLFVKVGCVLGLTVALRRAPFPYLWLVYAIVGALFSGRSNGHYALQVIAPLSISLAIFFRHRVEIASRSLVAMPAAILTGVILSSAIGWSLVVTGHHSFAARRMQWYFDFGKFALQQESYAMYRGQIDDHVNRNLRIVEAVASLPPGKILVWGNAPWLYVLSGRLPATPYTTAAWEPSVPGESAALRKSLKTGLPIGLVMISSPSPPLGSAAGALVRLYRPVSTVGNATIYALQSSPARQT